METEDPPGRSAAMNLDTKNLLPEVAAYIRSLEEKNRQLEKQLAKMQSLNE